MPGFELAWSSPATGTRILQDVLLEQCLVELLGLEWTNWTTTGQLLSSGDSLEFFHLPKATPEVLVVYQNAFLLQQETPQTPVVCHLSNSQNSKYNCTISLLSSTWSRPSTGTQRFKI